MVFIEKAERLGLISKLGTGVMETAISHVSQIKLTQNERFFLSVNISPLQLVEDGFCAQVAELLELYHFPGPMLNLEITESAECTFDTSTMETIGNIQKPGITIALDDVGTGYSLLKKFRNIQANFLKTEQEFILDIDNDRYQQYFLKLLNRCVPILANTSSLDDPAYREWRPEEIFLLNDIGILMSRNIRHETLLERATKGV